MVADLVLDQSLTISVAIPNHQKIYPPEDLVNINFSTTAPHGLFSTDFKLSEIRSIQQQYYRDSSPYANYNNYSPSTAASEYAAGSWRLNNNVNFSGGAVRTLAIIVPDIDEMLCGIINDKLWGANFIPPLMTESLSTWAGPPNPISGSPSSTSVPIAFDSVREACAESADNLLFYYRVITVL